MEKKPTPTMVDTPVPSVVMRGNKPAFATGQFGGAVEFSSNEWIFTDAFADTMEVGGNKPRTISIWFKPYLQSHWGSAPNHHNWDPGLYWMGTTMVALEPNVMDGDYGDSRGGSVGNGNNYPRMISA